MKCEGPILFATSNAHKVEEVCQIFAPSGIGVEGLDTLGLDIEPPAENEPTFAGNAVQKARYYALHTGRVCLADDSGLMVEALGGAPGVLSARYSGVDGPRKQVDAANNAKLLEALTGVPEARRTARFVCSMAVCDGDRVLAQAEGFVAGRILEEGRGRNGFGYDPLFYIPRLDRTAAELNDADKNAISHRGEAAQQLIALLIGSR